MTEIDKMVTKKELPIARVWESDVKPSAELLKSGNEADAEIKLGERTWKVHKLILCASGLYKYFNAAFAGGFEESTTNILSLDDDMFEEEDIDRLITFLYTGAIKFKTRGFMVDAINMFIVAGYFNVPTLEATVLRAHEFHVRDLARSLVGPKAAVKVEDDPLPNSITARLLQIRIAIDQIAAAEGEAIKTPVQEVMSAIERLEQLRIAGNLCAFEFFRPYYLRLVLCGRHWYPLESLCSDNPEFFKGWELLLDTSKLQASKEGVENRRLVGNMELYPLDIPSNWNKTCQKCKSRYAAGSVGCDTSVLDHVSWANAGGSRSGGIQWLCAKCYVCPSLKEWEVVRETKGQEKYTKERLELLRRQKLEIAKEIAQGEKWTTQQEERARNRLEMFRKG